MQLDIELPAAAEDRIRLLAVELGYDSTEAFVARYLTQLADQPAACQVASMTAAELAESLAMIDQSMAEIDAGKGLTIEEAREALLKPLREHAG